MPELPDISAYIGALETRILHRTLEHVRVPSIFLLRTIEPTATELEGHRVTAIKRLG